MNLFIDTNIFLLFFHFTSEDLQQLTKLSDLIKFKKIKLYLPQQVVDEFERNRDAKIFDALRNVEQQRIEFQFPHMCKEYSEYEAIRELLQTFASEKAKLLKKLKYDINKTSLKADDVIASLFAVASVIPRSPDLASKAELRYRLGNPPGKDGSLGDALNWESLLETVPDGEDLSFVGGDKDYRSKLDENSFNPFLFKEWKARKRSKLLYYPRLTAYFEEESLDISLANELEEERASAVEDFVHSGTFQSTHSAVEKLHEYREFSNDQVNAMADAALNNSQIRSIVGDSDVRDFLSDLVKTYSKSIEVKTRKTLRDILAGDE